jgi:cell division protein FtsB
MDTINSKINSGKQKLHDKGLYDVRLVVLILVGAISVIVFWNTAKIIQRNFELTQKVAQIQKENEVIELENRNKELQNQYLATDEFAELTARRIYGKASPGESVYIVPEEVAIASLQTTTDETVEEQNIEKAKYLKNLESWMNIYFRN